MAFPPPEGCARGRLFTQEADPTAAIPPPTKILELRLKNGMKVLLLENHTAPLVTVWCWYRVGSRDGSLGTSGISHWVEHLNFAGTRGFSREDIQNFLEEAGGYGSGFTSLDQTAYWETLSSTGLETALKLEAERMTSSLLAPDEVARERTVLRAEEERDENDPRSLLDREITAAAFKIHPYRWPVGGWLADTDSFTRDQLWEHYHRFYTPGNAILVVAGDIEPGRCSSWIQQIFESIPARPLPGRYAPREPVQEGERRLKILREGTVPLLQIAFRAPEILNDEFYAFLVIDAVLNGAKGFSFGFGARETAGGTSSRLHRALVDKKLATQVNTGLLPTQLPFLYKILLTLPDASQFQPAEEAVYDELEKIKVYGITESALAKARNQVLARHYLNQDSLTKRAHQLGFFESIASHTLLDQWEDKVRKVGQDDLRRVAIKYFSEKSRTVGMYLPQAKPRPIEVERLSASSLTWNPGAEIVWRPSNRPESVERRDPPLRIVRGFQPAFAPFNPGETLSGHSLPSPIALKPERLVLPNGLVVYAVHNPVSPTVTVKATVKAGSARDPGGQAGLAHLVGQMLDRGTPSQSALQLAESLEFIGADLWKETDYLTTTVTLAGLKKDFEVFLQTLAEMVHSASFPPAELEKVRLAALTALRQEQENPQAAARRTLRERIYPAGHPFHGVPLGSVTEVENIRQKDLADFYERYYRSDQVMLAISGDILPAEVFQKAEQAFGSWKPAPTPFPTTIPVVSPGLGAGKQVLTYSQNEQCHLLLGIPGASVADPDYYALQILSWVLGESGHGGRLGVLLKQKAGVASYVRSQLEGGMAGGPFCLSAGVKAQDLEKALELLLAEVDRLRTAGISKEEHAKAQRALSHRLPLELESNEGIARKLIEMEHFQLGSDYLSRYSSLLEGVSYEKLMDCWRTRLAFDQAAIVIVGPAQEKGK